LISCFLFFCTSYSIQFSPTPPFCPLQLVFSGVLSSYPRPF
jgi:hypothetical protein